MHSRGEVRSFLQSSANYWLKEYHFDGLRIDAVSRIIYWQGDERRGENGNAVDFIKVMNKGLKERNPGCMLIAEDSANYRGVTKETEQGGDPAKNEWTIRAEISSGKSSVSLYGSSSRQEAEFDGK